MSPEERIAYLEVRIAALEEALVVRSRELRALQKHLPRESLAALARLRRYPRGSMEGGTDDLALWQETTELQQAEVEETLRDLWSSLTIREAKSDGQRDAGE